MKRYLVPTIALLTILAMGTAAFGVIECGNTPLGPPPDPEDDRPCDQAPPPGPFCDGGIVIPSCTCFVDVMAITCLLVFCDTDCCLSGGVCSTNAD